MMLRFTPGIAPFHPSDSILRAELTSGSQLRHQRRDEVFWHVASIKCTGEIHECKGRVSSSSRALSGQHIQLNENNNHIYIHTASYFVVFIFLYELDINILHHFLNNFALNTSTTAFPALVTTPAPPAPAGAITGGVVGGLAAFLLFLLLITYLYLRHRRAKCAMKSCANEYKHVSGMTMGPYQETGLTSEAPPAWASTEWHGNPGWATPPPSVGRRTVELPVHPQELTAGDGERHELQ
ncbi:MAG: hypothetical protein M1829_002267 [Trizodia sp. TS-e1964]|nr:MAG: hypothetical protein M1829_002267 [Trizodia sp. TS-e1964]